MTESLLSLVSNMPHWLGVLLLSMIPVAELRLAIPIAITQYGFSPADAIAVTFVGNMIPVPLIILFIRPFFNWLRKFKTFGNLINKIENRGNSKADAVLKYKFWGLFLLVAIPLPGTGAWTGALVAALLDMRLKKAMPAIAMGVLTAGVVVTLATTGVLKFFGI